MKVVILAGGKGTRISEETVLKPKPMIEIGGKPILWHIMKIYSYFGINEFIVCCGYKGYLIKEYFANYFLHMSDVTFNMESNSIKVHKKNSEPWVVTLVDTGEKSCTGGRLKRVREYLDADDFCFTYGDGLADINISNLINFHKEHKRMATITAVKPPGRYGALVLDEYNKVNTFQEKPDGDRSWINGGFFVLNPKVIDLIENDYTNWEEHPLSSLANQNELYAYKHTGFWHPMDTLRDKIYLENFWSKDNTPWKVW